MVQKTFKRSEKALVSLNQYKALCILRLLCGLCGKITLLSAAKKTKVSSSVLMWFKINLNC